MSNLEVRDVAVTLPAPVVEVRKVFVNPPPAPDDPKLLREHQAFVDQFPQLLQTHYGQYVAFHEGEVVESGDDKVAVAVRAYSRFGYVPIYVHLVTDQPQPLESLPSARTGRSQR